MSIFSQFETIGHRPQLLQTLLFGIIAAAVATTVHHAAWAKCGAQRWDLTLLDVTRLDSSPSDEQGDAMPTAGWSAGASLERRLWTPLGREREELIFTAILELADGTQDGLELNLLEGTR